MQDYIGTLCRLCCMYQPRCKMAYLQLNLNDVWLKYYCVYTCT